MQKTTKTLINYWHKHRCWHCGRHSRNPKALKMIPKCNGFICIDCYRQLFGKEPN